MQVTTRVCREAPGAGRPDLMDVEIRAARAGEWANAGGWARGATASKWSSALGFVYQHFGGRCSRAVEWAIAARPTAERSSGPLQPTRQWPTAERSKVSLHGDTATTLVERRGFLPFTHSL